MAKKKIAYLQFPGSNTENETKNILLKHGMSPRGHFWNDSTEKLKYYDRMPLCVVLDVTVEEMVAANLHYVSPKKRVKTIEQLSKGKIDVPRRVIHKYKRSDVQNRLYIEIAESDWDSAMYLPLEQFVSAVGAIEVPVTAKKVWLKYDLLTKYRFRAKRKVQ